MCVSARIWEKKSDRGLVNVDVKTVLKALGPAKFQQEAENFKAARSGYIIRKGKESKMDSVKYLRQFLREIGGDFSELWSSSFK